MLDLNNNSFDGNSISIFNNGVSGLVKNVDIDVEKRRADEPETYPDYKLIVKDNSGATPLNMGFKRQVEEEKTQTQNIQRIKSITKAILPVDYVYPQVATYTEAVDALFKIIKENCQGKKVNVFTTYGYTAKPSKYLGLRYFDFIESADRPSTLREKPSDVMERLVEDAPANSVTEGPKSKESLDWTI